MSIEIVTTDDLRKMNDKEGLILQGCGGEIQDWIDGINDMLTESGILLNGSKFEKVYAFKNDNLTNLLYPFDDVELSMGKLAMWRIATHSQLYGTWLSDYVPNHLGGFIAEKQKPDCELIGHDSNIFNLMGIASRTLRENGMTEEATEMCTRIRESNSYNSALCIIGEYVNITGPDEDMSNDENFIQSM